MTVVVEEVADALDSCDVLVAALDEMAEAVVYENAVTDEKALGAMVKVVVAAAGEVEVEEEEGLVVVDLY